MNFSISTLFGRLRPALAALLLLIVHSAPGFAETFQTTAPVAFLMDADTHTILFEKSADTPVIPASTAKVMTAETVFNEIAGGRLHLQDQFVVSENAWRTGGALAHGSTMFAALGSSITVENLIRGLVIDSGNDAAVVLAEGIAGSEGNFAAMMTKRADDLGLPHLVFTNAWGKDDPNQRVTAREMVLLADHLIRTYPDLYKYFGEKDFTWNKIHQTNRNPLLAMDIGADGLKTGNIDEKSGFGLVGSAVQNGQRLILALYGVKSDKERSEEARKLLEWGFRSFESRSLFAANDIIGTAKVYGGAQGDVPLISKTPIKVLIPRGSDQRISGKIVYSGPLMAPVVAGTQVGRLQLFAGTDQLLEVPLVTGADDAVGSIPRRAMDAGLELGIDLFHKYILKD